MAGGNPLSPAAEREDELFPLNNGCFSNDPLHVWREAYVNYVPAAPATSDGQKAAAGLTGKNGVDADRTPFLRTFNDVQTALKGGLVTVTELASDGSQGPP